MGELSPTIAGAAVKSAKKVALSAEKAGSLLVLDVHDGDGRRVAVEHGGRVHVWEVAAKSLVECVDPDVPPP